MPSYGSNDGYGRQKLGARPSTRLTDIGQKQADSSRMAALLAEEDIRPQKSAHDPACNIVEVDPSAPPDVQWFQAARAGDGAALKRLLNERPALLTKSGRGLGNTALHWTSSAGHVDCAAWLIEQGTSVSVTNTTNATPLHAAAANGQLAAVIELLRRGADRTAEDQSGAHSHSPTHPRLPTLTRGTPYATAHPLNRLSNHRNAGGTAADLARLHGHVDVVQALGVVS